MKKSYTTAGLLLALSLGMAEANAQQVGNSDFELWENLGSNTEEPENWSSLKTANTSGCALCGAAPQVCWQESSIVHGGSYSMKLETVNYWGQAVNGAATIGRVRAGSTTASSSSNYNYTDIADATGGWNEIMTTMPDSIVFWANYTSGGGGDEARVSAVLHTNVEFHDPNDAGGATEIGSARQNFSSTTGWERIAVPFTYLQGTTPSYLLVTFTSSSVPGGGNVGSVLYIDDMELIYNPDPTIAGEAATDETTCGADDGTIVISATGGGGGPYEYSIDGGATWQSSGTFTGLAPGTYDVAIMEGLNHVVMGSTLTVGAASTPSIDSENSTDETSCGLDDGTITITTTPSGIEYSIDGGATYVSNSGAFTGLAAGSYDVSVRDGSCVTAGSTITINGVAAPTITTETSTDESTCGGNDGTITLAATSTGAGTVEYSIDGGATFSTTTSYTGLSAGSFAIVVQEGNCQTTGSTLTISSPSAPTFTLTSSDPTACLATDGSITLSGLTASTTFNVTYTDGGGAQGPTSMTSDGAGDIVLSGLGADTYTGFLVEIAGCTGSDPGPITLSDPAGPTIDSESAMDVTVCGATDGSITITTTPSGIEYSIDGGATYVSNGGSFTGLAAGTYDVTVRDGSCVTAGSTLTVGTPSNNITTSTVNTGVHYVSATQGAALSVPYTVDCDLSGGNNFNVELSDASGSFAAPVVIGTLADITSGTVNATIPAGTASGTMYRVRVVSDNPGIVGSDNGADIEIALVAVSIAPAPSQNLFENVAGTQIDAVETSTAADSREWKNGTASGGPYNSFAPAETGTSYTPLFAAAGTYYVVCESTWGTLTETSNEVIINVSTSGIEENERSWSVFVQQGKVVVDLSELNSGDAQFVIMDMSGRTVHSSQLNSGSINKVDMDFSEGVYVVQVSGEFGSHSMKAVLK